MSRIASPPAVKESTFVEVSGLRLRYSIEGSGPPLLLLTGIGANLDMWAPFRKELTGFETIAVDLPGAGESVTPMLPVTMRGLAKLASGLLDVLGYPVVSVLGYSFGGLVAQQLAHLRPDRVDRLVLAATGCGVGAIPGRLGAMLSLLTPTRYYSRGNLEQVGPSLYGGRSRREPEVLAGLAGARLHRPPTARGYLWQLMATSGWTSLPWLGDLRMPTLVLSGEDDPAVPPVNGRLLAARIPNARFELVPGGGHLMLLDQAADVAPLVREFLRSGAGQQDGRPV